VAATLGILAILISVFVEIPAFAEPKLIAQIAESLPLIGIDKVHAIGIKGQGVGVLIIDDFTKIKSRGLTRLTLG
jgi:hypothetical protein